MNAALGGQRIVLTGAAQGLGRAVAVALAAAGARLLLMDRDADGLASLAATLAGEHQTVAVDLSDGGATASALGKSRLDTDPATTLIHNAAVLTPKPFAAMDLDDWQRTVDVGLLAAFLLTRAVWPGMAAARGGAIVYVSSRSGIEGFVDESAYCAAKHGLEGLMKSLAMEGAPLGIAVNTITPGMFMKTPMSERNYDAALKAKWVDPAELAPAFVALAARQVERSGERLDAWQLSRMQERT